MGFFGLFSLVAMGIASIVEDAKISDYNGKAKARAKAQALTGENRLGVYVDYKGGRKRLSYR